MTATARDGVTISLESTAEFRPNNVSIIGQKNTEYTCSYINDHHSILNITDSKTFSIEGGILKYGNTSLANRISYYFIILEGSGDASLYLLDVEIEFVSVMSNIILISGGNVILEDIKINNQPNTMWVYALVCCDETTSDVTIYLHSCNITNSYYKSFYFSYRESAVIFLRTSSEFQKSINMSHCLFHNNSFHVGYQGNGGVACCEKFKNNSFISILSFLFFIFSDKTMKIQKSVEKEKKN
jgi:hypothetical protein